MCKLTLIKKKKKQFNGVMTTVKQDHKVEIQELREIREIVEGN